MSTTSEVQPASSGHNQRSQTPPLPATTPPPGWWLASDGRYYPPWTRPGHAAGSQSTPPRNRSRWWIWLAVGIAGIAILGALAVLLVIRSSPAASEQLVAFDFTSQDDAEPQVQTGTDAVGAPTTLIRQITDGRLNLRIEGTAAMYAREFTLPSATDTVTVNTTWEWTSDISDLPRDAIAGIMIVNDNFEGYGLTCGTSGDAYLLLLLADSTSVIDIFEGAGCQTANTMALGNGGGSLSVLDNVLVALPDGTSAVVIAESAMGPFTDVGFMTSSGDLVTAAPELSVVKYSVWVDPDHLR